jgi:hypothetical protein
MKVLTFVVKVAVADNVKNKDVVDALHYGLDPQEPIEIAHDIKMVKGKFICYDPPQPSSDEVWDEYFSEARKEVQISEGETFSVQSDRI